MSGLFPSICNAQNVNANGLPLVSATLTVYNGGTLQLASVYQDIGLAIPGQNPMNTDITGRLPFFYVADGTYRVRLVDANGVVIYDLPQVASIGASSSGGGGSAVDPTTIFQTGDDLWTEVGGVRSGWVRQNGLTIGSATSGASERANADCQNLFLYLWNKYSNSKCPVVGGRGANAVADWGANKQITMPDKRGRGVVGADGMGNTRANILPDGNITSGGGDTGDTPTAYGGEANHVLITNEIPSHSHGVTDPGHAHGINDPTHSHSYADPGHVHQTTDPGHNHTIGGPRLNNASAGSGGPYNDATSSGYGSGSSFTGVGVASNVTGINIDFSPTGISIRNANTGISIQSAGGGTSHNNMPPFVVGYWYKKLVWLGAIPMIGELAMQIISHFSNCVYSLV